MPHERGQTITIEEGFDSCVKEIGGAKVSDVVGYSPGFSNADYYFNVLNLNVALFRSQAAPGFFLHAEQQAPGDLLGLIVRPMRLAQFCHAVRDVGL